MCIIYFKIHQIMPIQHKFGIILKTFVVIIVDKQSLVISRWYFLVKQPFWPPSTVLIQKQCLLPP